MSRRALLLVNPNARRGQQDLQSIRHRLSHAAIQLVEPSASSALSADRRSATDSRYDAASLIQQHRDLVDLVIVGGGDGTVHHLLGALLETRLPLGILPLGTANDLARTLLIPPDPIEACDVIIGGKTQQIDIGVVNERPYLNVANIGLAAEVTRRLSRSTKTRWGVLAYAWAAAGAMLRSRSFSVEISGTGEPLRTRSWQIAVGNGRFYGGGLTIHENAEIDDGLLDLYSLEIRSRWQILPLIPALWRGILDPVLPVRTCHGTEFTVRPLRRTRSIVADGELVGKTPAVFRILPKALTVLVPESDQN